MDYPIPPSHRTFQFGQVVIDSNFDSGNCSNAEKSSTNNYLIWIGVDHPKNQYRTWFHFSIKGHTKSSTLTFTIKNMQNQSRLLKEGLVPVYREQSCQNWKRVSHKIDQNSIEYNQGWIEWSFKHTMPSQEKTFFAFFYPWSNLDNDRFLNAMEQKCKANGHYFKRSNIINTLQGRPVQFITISSKKGLTTKDQAIQDKNLFPNGGKPKQFNSQKTGIVIGARVHPGEVPASHVMTGIIKALCSQSVQTSILLDRFVFYIFPIFNPDGVARGHYRVDTNGINLNRCYINPSPKHHPPIYAVKKIIMHLHSQERYFAFLDLHAHAARKGIFIYGNSSDELSKQVDACIFPKILSMNSVHFEYEGSNFTEKNMYCKEKNDHVSKEGAGRVALFKATKNPNSWTIQCNYNMSRVENVLEPQKAFEEEAEKPTQTKLDTNTIIQYRYPITKESKQFYTIETYHQFGQQICQSFLDLIEMNPRSRIDNSKNHFKSVQNLKMNLAIALLRMAPNRFQTIFKRIYHAAENANVAANPQMPARAVKALYLILIKSAKIQNINAFLKDNDESSVVYAKTPVKSKTQVRKAVSLRQRSSKNQFPILKTSRVELEANAEIEKLKKEIKEAFLEDEYILKPNPKDNEDDLNSSDDQKAISIVFDQKNDANQPTEDTDDISVMKQSLVNRQSRLFVKNDFPSFQKKGVFIGQSLNFQSMKPSKPNYPRCSIKLVKLAVHVEQKPNAQLPSIALMKPKPPSRGASTFQRQRSSKNPLYFQSS